MWNLWLVGLLCGAVLVCSDANAAGPQNHGLRLEQSGMEIRLSTTGDEHFKSRTARVIGCYVHPNSTEAPAYDNWNERSEDSLKDEPEVLSSLPLLKLEDDELVNDEVGRVDIISRRPLPLPHSFFNATDNTILIRGSLHPLRTYDGDSVTFEEPWINWFGFFAAMRKDGADGVVSLDFNNGTFNFDLTWEQLHKATAALEYTNSAVAYVSFTSPFRLSNIIMRGSPATNGRLGIFCFGEVDVAWNSARWGTTPTPPSSTAHTYANDLPESPKAEVRGSHGLSSDEVQEVTQSARIFNL